VRLFLKDYLAYRFATGIKKTDPGHSDMTGSYAMNTAFLFADTEGTIPYDP